MSRISLPKSAGEGLKDLLRHLLEQKKVSAVFTVKKNISGFYDLGLITDPDGIDQADPMAPVMIANAGQVLSSLTPATEPIVAVLKPCELRSLVERVKREQGNLDNIITISWTCPGAFPLDRVREGLDTETLDQYWKVAGESGIEEEIKDTCKGCVNFVPMGADITISAAGDEKVARKCSIFPSGEKAEALLEGISGEKGEKGFDDSSTEKLASKREAEKKRLFQSVISTEGGLDALVDTFGKCIGCHACGRVCPICYCTLCDFESRNFDNDVSYYERELGTKGALRLPPDTIFYHLGRLTHMSFSCVGCGLCSDVCPARIPVASVFKKTGEETAGLFDYLAGRDLEEPIPVMVFKEEEFKEYVDD